MGWCNKCKSYNCSCRTWCSAPPITPCSCAIQLGGNCVFYKGTTTPCLGIANGTDYDTIIKALDAAICTLSPSGQFITIVNGVSGQTTVARSVIGNTTYYTVGLAPAVVSQINSNTSAISTINGILPTLTDTITSSSLIVTHPNGHTWNIENPSGLFTNCTGVVYSDFVSHNTSSSSNMIDNTINYTASTCPNVQIGDVISYKILGSYTVGSPPSEFTVSIMNGSSVIQTRVGSVNISSSFDNYTSAFSIEIKLFITSSTTAIMNCLWMDTPGASQVSVSNTGVVADESQKQAIGKHLTGLDFSALRVKVDQTAGTGNALNFVNLFTSDILKHY